MNSPLSSIHRLRRQARFSRAFSPVVSENLRERIEENSIAEGTSLVENCSIEQRTPRRKIEVRGVSCSTTPVSGDSRMSATQQGAALPEASANNEGNGNNSGEVMPGNGNVGQGSVNVRESMDPETINRITTRISQSMRSGLVPGDVNMQAEAVNSNAWREEFQRRTGTQIGPAQNSFPVRNGFAFVQNAGLPVNLTAQQPANIAGPSGVNAHSGGGTNHWSTLTPGTVQQRLRLEYKQFKLEQKRKFLTERAQVITFIGNAELSSSSDDDDMEERLENFPNEQEQRLQNQRNITSEQRRQSRDDILERLRQVNLQNTNNYSNLNINQNNARATSAQNDTEITSVLVPSQATITDQPINFAGAANRPSSLNIPQQNGTYVPPPRRQSAGAQNQSAIGLSGISSQMNNLHLQNGISSHHDSNWRSYYPQFHASTFQNQSSSQNNANQLFNGVGCSSQTSCNCYDCLRMYGFPGNANTNPLVTQPTPFTQVPPIFSGAFSGMYMPSNPAHTHSTSRSTQPSLGHGNRHHLKSVDIPTYSGFTEKKTPYDFLCDIEKYRQISGISFPMLLLQVIPIALTDDAFHWYNMEMQWNPFPDWENFKSRFREQFQPHDYSKRLVKELGERSQGPDESLSYFLRVIAGYFERLGVQDEQVLIERVCDQMHPDYKRYIPNANGFGSLADFSNVVKSVDKRVQSDKQYRPPRVGRSIEPTLAYKPIVQNEPRVYSSTPRSLNSSGDSFRLQETRHDSRNMDRRQVSFESDRRDQHNSRSPSNDRSQNERSNSDLITLPSQSPRDFGQRSFDRRSPVSFDRSERTRSPSPARRNIECFECGENHYVRDCPKRKEKSLNSNSLGAQTK